MEGWRDGGLKGWRERALAFKKTQHTQGSKVPAPTPIPEALAPSPGLCWHLHMHVQPLSPHIHRLKREKSKKKEEEEELKGEKRRGEFDQMTEKNEVSRVATGGIRWQTTPQQCGGCRRLGAFEKGIAWWLNLVRELWRDPVG